MTDNINVGTTIKNIRTEKKLFLKDVAARCNISSSMLSQIEKGNANPSLNTLKSIAQVLEVPIFKFFLENTEETSIPVLKKENRKIIITENLRYELISPTTSTNIEFIEMVLTNTNSDSSDEPTAHKGEEIALLVSGRVKLYINDNFSILEPGDSVYIPPMEPHRWVNLHDGESIVLFSVTPPDF